MTEIVDVTGDGQGNVFLIKGEGNLLYEAGMAYCTKKMIDRVKEEIGEEPVAGVLISHSHYDHVGGLPAVRRAFEGAVTYGSLKAQEILKKPSALRTIRELSIAAGEAAGTEWDRNYRDEDMGIDVGLADGEELSVGGHAVKVMETIGHTKCALSYLVDDEILFCSETIGVLNRDKRYIPAFLVDYRKMTTAIEKSRRMHPERVVISHYGLLSQEETPKIWDFLLERAEESKDIMLQVMKRYSTKEERLAALEKIFHTGIDQKDQPDEAFYINAASMMRTLERQFLGGEMR